MDDAVSLRGGNSNTDFGRSAKIACGRIVVLGGGDIRCGIFCGYVAAAVAVIPRRHSSYGNLSPTVLRS